MFMAMILWSSVMAWSGQSAAPSAPAEPPQLLQSMDGDVADRCMRDQVGFRNVQLNCITGSTGTLEQCEIMTDNPRVLRYSRTLRCAASSIRMSQPDGSPAVGVQVGLRFVGSSWSVAQLGPVPPRE